MRTRCTFILFLFSTLLLAQGGIRVVGYLPTYRFDNLAQLRLDRCTHINIAFANPDLQGNLTTEGLSIAPAVAAAKQQGAKVFISLAGGYLTPAWKAAWDTLLQPARRPAFIQKIVQYCLTHQLDGVDVDLEWQYVNNYYSPFVLELKPALAAYNLQLTAALPGSHRYPQVSNAALAAFDWVNMMVYDLRGPWDPSNPGPHSPYDWAVQCIQYWKNQGVPANRLTLGVPFYGYDFGVSPVASFTFRSMVNLSTGYAYVDQVNQRYYNGIPTIQAKTQLALGQVSGIMIWELGQDVLDPGQDQYSLLRAIDEVVQSIVAVTEASGGVLRLFPNPAGDWVQASGGGELTVFDLNGRAVMTETVAGDAPAVLSLQSLPAGVYVVQRRQDGRACRAAGC
ncbi:MAG: T9SS type A sorting domain-containing protein [Saprospirales bacterium]|nr:T9SS type A sorting domain-containing protein [Saprospirales bacterium]